MSDSLIDELEFILGKTGADLWEPLRGKTLFITGGTGFVGSWLLESFIYANDRLGLDARAMVLSRNPAAFASKLPHLASHPALRFIQGDVRDFDFPEIEISYVIHAATDVCTPTDKLSPITLLDTIFRGTRRTLDFAVRSGAKDVLLLSSGAVYGRQPPSMTHIAEEYEGGLATTNADSTYAEGKRAAELLCTLYAGEYGLRPRIARGFAFVGPYLPLDARFAIGNFIHNGLQGKDIVIHGDGTSYRSYLYAADMAVWLWTILLRGDPGSIFNVGSDAGMTIMEIAQAVAEGFAPAVPVSALRRPVDGALPQRYVPAIERARKVLGLEIYTPLKLAIRKTIDYHRGLAAPTPVQPQRIAPV